ncbi:Glutathione S-transferase [gamma proteobacterium HdN1]|nr:Glutathione S-transferase [gamma proteobacterium HdN1]
MKLYYSPGACSLSPLIALHEAGIKVELIKVDLRSKAMANGGNYLDINPNGFVPALQLDSGEILTEGPAIVQYIADLAPNSHIAPPNGTLDRVHLQEALNFVSSEVHKGFSPLFHPALPAEWKAIVLDKLSQRFDYLAKRLEKSEWLVGKQFTVADGYLFTVLGWTVPCGIDLSRWPALVAYRARIAERPKVKEAIAAQ